MKFFWQKKDLTQREIDWLIGDNGDSDIKDGIEAYKINSWVRRGTNLITDKISSAGWGIYNAGGNKSDIMTRMFAKVSGMPFDVFVRSMEFWRITYGFALVTIKGKQIIFVDPRLVTVKDGKLAIRDKEITDDYVLYKGDLINPQGLGRSILEPTFPYVTLEKKLVSISDKILTKGAFFSLMMINDKPVNDKVLKEYMDMFRVKYSGMSNASKTPFLSGGWKPQQNPINLQQLAIGEMDAVVKNQVSTVLGIPISLLNDTQSNTAAREKLVQDRKSFLYDTIIPRANQFTQFFNTVLKIMYGAKYTLQLDFTHMLDMVADRKLEEEIRQIRVNAGYMTRNEAREEIGLKPISGGDSLLVPINLMPLGVESSGKSEAKSEVKSDAKFTHDQIWKSYFKRVQPQEKKLIKVLNKFFDKMEKEALSKLNEKSYGSKGILDAESLLKEFEKMLFPYLTAFAQQSGDATISDYGLEIDFEADNPQVRGFISAVLKTSGGEVIRNTEKELQPIFDEALRTGQPTKETEKQIRELFKGDKARRPQAIARTETNRINNYASVFAAKDGGLTHKIWVSALIPHVTRDWHAAADNQRVAIDDAFLVGGELLQYPGDPNGSAENVINCLCTVIYT